MGAKSHGGARFEALCGLLTEHLRSRGSPGGLSEKNNFWVWLKDELGDEEYGRQVFRHGSGEHSWRVWHAEMSPGPRCYVIDYADVEQVEMGETTSRRHLALDWINADNIIEGTRSRIVEIKCEKPVEVSHRLGNGAAMAAERNIAHDVMMSFHAAMATCVEAQVCRKFFKAHKDGKLAVTMKAKGTSGREGASAGGVLAAGDILDAAAKIAQKNPQVPFPRGIVCVLSPEQAVQLFNDPEVHVDSMDVCGIDMVVSPVMSSNGDSTARFAMVVAKRSISVAASRIEVRIHKNGDGEMLRAKYMTGVEINPKMTAAVVSGMGGA